MKIMKGIKDLVAEAEAAIQTMSVDQVKAAMSDPNVQLVDIRDIRELWRDGGIPGEVYCDNSPNVIVCSAAQNCCLLNPGQEYCTPKATPCACTGANCDATTVSCDGPEDCSGGQICCGTFSQQANAYTTLKCQSTCGGQWEREICKPNGTCTTSGQTCSQSSFLTSYIWRCN